eukprot:TRINITY_DN2180_c0_g1_i1.p1 TRINITY_DN2180_c0_g1~~TRINITY_DN2180_c0_g1_i1.p1  ORF type:complete len:363 (+),score=96.94 TRINITY_DN2180_c0_g1_i1:79-1167(+)
MMKGVVFAVALGLASASDRAAMIEKIKNTPGVQWTAGFTERFGNTPLDSMRPLLGVTPEAMAARAEFAKKERLKSVNKKAVELPKDFDSEKNWPHCAKVIGDIRDQSMCGCCWAFAAAEAASDRLCIATNASIAVPLSAQDVCFCASQDGCNGGDIFTPWTYIQQNGAVTGGQYKGSGPFGKGFCSDFSMPHCHHHGPQRNDPFPDEGSAGCPQQTSPQCPSSCDSDAAAPHNDFSTDKLTFDGLVLQVTDADDIAQAIMAGGPVETAFTVFKDFSNYVGGIYHHVDGEEEGGHAVRIVGWGEENGQKYWKVANSWNPYWGEKGYFRIRRGNNEAGIENMVTASAPHSKWGKKSASGLSVVV